MIEYSSIPETPGKLYFDCDRLRSKLSTESCADSWQRANTVNDGSRIQCRLCPTGAAHAGESNASTSGLRNTRTCGRCHRSASRLISGHLCVSCYNREREFIKGSNAKGTPVVKLKALQSREIRYRYGGQIVSTRLTRSIDTAELIVAALRDGRELMQFAFSAHIPSGPAQGRLWG